MTNKIPTTAAALNKDRKCASSSSIISGYWPFRLLVSIALSLSLPVCALRAQGNITLKGTTYTLQGHPRVFFDGPSGPVTTAITGSIGVLAPRAVNSNVPWATLVTRSNAWLTVPYTDPDNIVYFTGGQQAAMYATRWYSDRSQTAAHDAVLDMLNHIEAYYPMFCDETQDDCYYPGGLGYGATSYGWVYWNQQWLMAYELMRGEMTSQQRTDFASKWLNDISAFGGISGSAGTSCTNPSVGNAASITVSGVTVTAGTPVFGPGQAIQVGYWVTENGPVGSANPVKVVSVIDSTHATISSILNGGWSGYSGPLGYRRATWQTGDCGIVWTGKHGRFVPQSLAYSSGVTAYPTIGGQQQDYSSNNTYAIFGQAPSIFLSLIEDDANASVRSQAELTATYNDWYDNVWSTYVEHGYTGFHYTGSNYGLERPLHMAELQQELSWSISGTPPALGTIWTKNYLYHYLANWVPGCPGAEPQWGQDFSQPNGFGTSNNLYPVMPIYAFWKDSTEGAWFNWTLRNRFSTCTSYGNAPGTNLFWTTGSLSGSSANALDQWFYIYTDPAWAATAMTSGAPTAFAETSVDAGSATYPQSALLSRTGYSSVTDTLVNFYGLAEQTLDHNYPSNGYYPGAYKIIKGNYLLAADGDQYNDPNSPYANVLVGYHDGGSHSNYVEIGGNANLKVSGNGPCGTTMPRTNTDGTNNRFAYAMIDSTACYLSGVTRAQRQLIDFKGGTQQFVLAYDDIATSSGATKIGFLHYPNNLGASSDMTRGVTTVSGSTVTSSNPGTGHSDNTQLLTKVIAPSNQVRVYTDNSDGTYAGGYGKTFRVSMCATTNGTTCDATNTAAEFIAVHEPVTGSGNSLPAISSITADSHFAAVQVSGSAPKVALFGRSGSTYTSASFTSTHSGTAQIMIAGLQAGSYVAVGPSTVNATVAADGVMYFEGTAGTWAIGAPSSGAAVSGKTGISGKVSLQ